VQSKEVESAAEKCWSTKERKEIEMLMEWAIVGCQLETRSKTASWRQGARLPAGDKEQDCQLETRSKTASWRQGARLPARSTNDCEAEARE
jgi:hypothetical protein